MIKIENTEVIGWSAAIRGMRNPMNSWEKSDSGICKGGDSGIGCENCANQDCEHTYDHSFQLGKADHDLMTRLAAGGPVHAKYRRMLTVYVDITAPLYWWKEFDTYKVGTVANSCSTMHKIHAKEFTIDDFSVEHLLGGMNHYDEREIPYIDLSPYNDKSIEFSPRGLMEQTINMLNLCRERYMVAIKTEPETGLPAKDIWWQLIQLLPSSYNQKRTVMLNYEVLAGIYPMRKNHKLDEWHEFCHWIKTLPYSEIIVGEDEVKLYAGNKEVASLR